MTTMKKTLLDSVQDIEQEASTLVKQAQERAEQEVITIRQNAMQERELVQQRAAQTSQSIIEEHLKSARAEAIHIKEESKHIVSKIHTFAQGNRERAIKKVKELCKEEYDISL